MGKVREVRRKLWQILKEETACALGFVFVFSLWFAVHLSFLNLVVGKATEFFNASRARNHLERISNVGPHPVGSVQNDIITVNFLLEQVEQIRAESATGPNVITVDTQKPSGTVILPYEFIYYDQITNIVVRLEPRAGAQHFILVNCHFDSAPNSPGAGDDAVSCAVMLEVLHSLSSLSTPLKHGVIFLFNGAEERDLEASHGFITQHPWVKEIRAFVNLDAAGAGGKELLFQSNSPWLVQAYADSAVHPFASVVGQEVFQSDLIPSDTDFRIFRDFGDIHGIDLAFIENGFVYHTKYDTPDRVSTGTIQRAGDNILALLKHVVTTEMLADPSASHHDNMVFFDILGMTMVTYSARAGTIFNSMVAVATFIYLTRNYWRCCSLSRRYVCHLALVLVLLVLSWFLALGLVYIVVLMVTRMGRSMFWFNHFYASICLYGSAAVGTILLFHKLVKHLIFRTQSQQMPNTQYILYTTVLNMCRLHLANLFFDASLLLWCCALIVLTVYGICSAYVPMLMVFFPLVFKLLLSIPITCRDASPTYLLVCLFCLFPPYVHLFYIFRIVYVMFIPIMGRTVYPIPSDMVVAMLIAIETVLLSSFLIHLLYIANSTKRVLVAVFTLFAVTFLLVSCGAFFPYSANPARPKRLDVQHITCSLHNLDGSLIRADSGFWISSFDYTGMSYITPHVPEINTTICVRCDSGTALCHFPWFPRGTFCRNRWYIPGPAVSPKSPLVFRQVSKQVTQYGTINMSFEAKGPSHMSMFILPSDRSYLTRWSLGDSIPWYQIVYSHGVNAGPWTFWIEVKPNMYQSEVVSIAISAHYIIGEDQSTPELHSLLEKFPDWAFTSSWVSTYDMYKY